MGFSSPPSIGIIACPGGESFTEKMIPHLKNLYKRNYDKRATDLSKRYGLSREEAMVQMNLSRDVLEYRPSLRRVKDSYMPPEFKLPVEFTMFANGEFKASINSSIRGMDVYIVQDVEHHYPISFPNSSSEAVLSVNDHIMCLFVTIDAAVQAGANRITLVLPTYPYSRQHKRKGREGLTAPLFAKICEFMGVSRILTLDIHSKEIENSCHTLSIENLHASYQILRKLVNIIDVQSEDLVIVSPDTGAVDRNKFYAGNLQRPLAMLYKERDYSKVSKDASHSNIKSARLLGDVKDKIVFMSDDMLGTGGTLIKAMSHLRELGAKQIVCAVSLPLFTGTAIDEFQKAYDKGYFDYIIGTDAVYHDATLLDKEWYISSSVSDLFAQFIMRLHHNQTTSPLLDNSLIIQKLLAKKDVES
ncbi:MAG: ribose-phosphate diphosphokinase [Spirochaetales bacterium]|nr:ribose-phosphate diphosphokinase [Spirochaetales bacterium]